MIESSNRRRKLYPETWPFPEDGLGYPAALAYFVVLLAILAWVFT
jgi:hypothetical protein